MSKKLLLIGLTPVLLAVGFAVIPTVAQAEPHFYGNHVGLPAESGGPGAEGKDIIAWGKLELEAKSIGKLVCLNEFGGDTYNPEGPEGARPGEGKIDAYAAYDCTSEQCEALKFKIEIIPEGLEKFGEWESKLSEPEVGVIRLKLGNKTPNSPTQIKFLIFCPPAGPGEIKTPTRGELAPKVKNGTLIGSAPSKAEFGLGSGELELAGVPEGKVNGSLKVMGYETGELITTSNP
jgi:hypothetical protein